MYNGLTRPIICFISNWDYEEWDNIKLVLKKMLIDFEINVLICLKISSSWNENQRQISI